MIIADYRNFEDYQVVDGTKVHLDWNNQRLKIMSCKLLNQSTLRQIIDLAIMKGMGKIIATAPTSCAELFLRHSFEVEGRIKGFFTGEDAFCYSYFISPARKISSTRYNGILPSGSCWDLEKPETLPMPYIVKNALETDIPGMIELFRRVFKTYPSPVFDAEYLQNNILTNRVLYKIALHNGKIIGIASADKDQSNLNAEMTDCVTSPDYRGQGILTLLLGELEADLYQHDFICLYTLCRSTQPMVNKAFLRQGYTYSGRLIKNCTMCGDFEDMNILAKVIRG